MGLLFCAGPKAASVDAANWCLGRCTTMEQDKPKRAAIETDEDRFSQLKRRAQRKDAGSAAADDAIDAMVKQSMKDHG